MSFMGQHPNDFTPNVYRDSNKEQAFADAPKHPVDFLTNMFEGWNLFSNAQFQAELKHAAKTIGYMQQPARSIAELAKRITHFETKFPHLHYILEKLDTAKAHHSRDL